MSASMNRREFIGGSDIGKILGFSDFGDAFSLCLEKIGEINPPEAETKAQRRGKILEPAIIQLHAAEYNVEFEPGATVTSASHPHYRAQIDALERTADGLIPCEIKSVSEYMPRHLWGASGSDDAPTAYCAQLHWQMMLMDAPCGRIRAMLGADYFPYYTIERDPDVDKHLLDRAAWFWQCVQSRTPPEIDFAHPSTGDTLARLFNKPNATEILQADDSMRSWRDVLVEASEKLKQYEAVRDGAKAHLLSLMGNAAIINFGDGQMYERKTIKRKGYTVADCTYIDARLKKAASSKAGAPALTEMEPA